MFLQQLFSLHWEMKPEVLTPFSMQDASSSANSANWKIKLSLLTTLAHAKGSRTRRKWFLVGEFLNVQGSNLKSWDQIKKRLQKTVMNKIHGYTILTTKVTWHGRLISLSFLCLHLPNQGKTDVILMQILISHYLHPICPQNTVQPSLATDVLTSMQRSINMNSEFSVQWICSQENTVLGKKAQTKA